VKQADTSDSSGTDEQKENVATFFEELAVEKMTAVGKKENPDVMKLIVIERMKTQASLDLQEVLHELEKNNFAVTSGIATAVGAGTGAATSLAALSSLGTVSGLSAAGVTTGLVAAGELFAGGMLVGAGVLAAPIAVLGALGYGLARKRRQKGRAAAIYIATQKICDIRSQLLSHKESFGEELAHIKTVLETITSIKTA
jgi:hypothetical protein